MNEQTLNRIAWAVRTVMVTVAAVVAYLLVQTDVVFEPGVNMILGAIAVALAALNPVTVATQLAPKGGG